MNVAIFASAFHPHFGGVEELCRQLAHEQQSCGSEPLIVTNRWPKNLPVYEKWEGLPIRRYLFRVRGSTFRHNLGALLCGRATLDRICSDLETHAIDLIHVQCVSSNSEYAIRASRRLDLPLVVTLQGELTMDANQIYQRDPAAKERMQRALFDADMITGCSQHTVREAEEFVGAPFGTRARVVHNGVRLADFEGELPHGHPRPYIFSIGRHAPQKGFDNLLRAFAEVLDTGEIDHDLLLAGDGPERRSLEQLSGELGISDRIQFIGRTDHEESVRLFLGCSFFVLSSRADEGLPVVSVEALAAGKAIVATRSGGTPEAVLDGKNGFLVPKNDVRALAAGMKRLTADASLRKEMGAYSSEHARNFDWPVIARQYGAVYEAAINRQPRAAGP